MSVATTVRRIGFYAGRLRKERISKLVFVSAAVLALMAQLLSGVMPLMTDTANAAVGDPRDNIVYQGVKDKADMLAIYDRNTDSVGHKDLQQIYAHFGVTRADLANTTMGSYKTNDQGGKINTLSRLNYNVPGRYTVAIPGTSTTVYTGPFLDNYNSKGYVMPALIGKRAVDGKWFAITLDCGNLVYVTPPVPPKPKPQPAAACVSLTISKISRTNLNIIAKASVANGATVKAFHYVVTKDGKVVTDRVIPTTGTGSQINQGYEAGTYTAKVTVQTSLGNLTSANCAQTFTIPPAPAVPAYSCDNLALTKISRTDVRLTGTASASGGAKIVSYTFDFGDGTTKTVTNPADVAHSYKKAGTYRIKMSVTVTVDGKTKTVTSDDCAANFTVQPEECLPGIPVGDERCSPKPEECLPGIPVGDVRCTPKVEECLPGVPVGDARCTPKVEECLPGVPVGDARCTPAELPKTGSGGVIGSLLGAGSLIASVGYYVSSRRGLLSAFLNR